MHITEFQKMMRQIYFHHDSKRGAKGTYLWLVEEVEELGEAIKGKNKKALENEFADVLAWLASLANVVDTNLEEATMAKYNHKCPRCKQVSCRCIVKFR
ncbi:MAG: MazG nucleotide pyrophosphohydrolase domain-containing protein [Candidatus Bathyarchaeota archaeon]|jgi:NTP pyrophosphatase (non-canonical NTP hydrolase)